MTVSDPDLSDPAPRDAGRPEAGRPEAGLLAGGGGVVVEAARPGDASALFEVQVTTWLATYCDAELGFTEAGLRVRLEGAGGVDVPGKVARWRDAAVDRQLSLFVARAAGRVVGFSASRLRENRRYINGLYVLPEAQGRGVGTRLLDRAVAAVWQRAGAGVVYVTVAAFNDQAIGFYRRRGFTPTGGAVRDEYVGVGGGPMPLIELSRSGPVG